MQDVVIGGRPATAMFINDAFEPVDEADATLVRVRYTDAQGGSAFLVRSQAPAKRSSAQVVRAQRMEVARERAERVLKFDPNQPRDEDGKWSSDGGGGGGGATPTPAPAAVAPAKPAPRRGLGQAAPGADDRVSTRVPTAKGQGFNPHQGQDLGANYATLQGNSKMTGSVGKVVQAYATQGLPGKYPPFLRLPADATPAQANEALVEHARANLTALYDAQNPDFRERSHLWYQGSNKLANDMAQEYGVSPRAAAGVIASLSPQKDWDQNVDLAKRVLDAVKDKDVPFTGARLELTRERMLDYAQVKLKEADDLEATLPDVLDKTDPDIRGKLLGIENRRRDVADIERLSNTLDGKSLAELPLADQAMVVRFHDEATTSREYVIWNPDGTPSGAVGLTKAGEPRSVAWGGFDQIGNALSIAHDDSRENISTQLGGNHKVRNFYNNIISPEHGQDATIDTHAVAAALLMPLGGEHPLVKQGLGVAGPKNAETGLKGLYTLYHEAYRRAAEDRGVLPREMQSAAWEAVRGLYPPEAKRSRQLEAQINGIWKQYHEGKLDLAAAQQQILARGIQPPRWAAGGA